MRSPKQEEARNQQVLPRSRLTLTWKVQDYELGKKQHPSLGFCGVYVRYEMTFKLN